MYEMRHKILVANNTNTAMELYVEFHVAEIK